MGKFLVLSLPWSARKRSSRYHSSFSPPKNRLLTVISARGTSGELRHPRRSRYRCSLPGTAGFAGPHCTEPEVLRFGSRDCLRLRIQSSTAMLGSLVPGVWKIYFPDFDFAAGAASGGCTSDGFTQFTLNGPAPCTCTMVSPL